MTRGEVVFYYAVCCTWMFLYTIVRRLLKWGGGGDCERGERFSRSL